MSRKGGMLAPPSPPAKFRRLGLASGSSKSRVVPRFPSRVAAALGSTACSRGSRSPARDLVQVAQDSALSHPACRSWRPGKVCCGRRAARPWDFHSCARSPPQRVAMETAGSWWWNTDPAHCKDSARRSSYDLRREGRKFVSAHGQSEPFLPSNKVLNKYLCKYMDVCKRWGEGRGG